MDTLIALIALFVVTGFVGGYLFERRRWNKGACRECQTPWKAFDMDSQGSTGYKCACSVEWFSWPMPVRDVSRRGT